MWYETSFPEIAQSDETVLQSLVRYPVIVDLWSYIEQLLSRVGWIRLSSKFIVVIAPLPSFNWTVKVFLCQIVVVKELFWW